VTSQGLTIAAWASQMIYDGPTAQIRPQEKPVLDRGRLAGRRLIDGPKPILRLSAFLAGVGSDELKAALAGPVDLELELDRVGLVSLEKVDVSSRSLVVRPGGVWLEMEGLVEGRISRNKSKRS